MYWCKKALIVTLGLLCIYGCKPDVKEFKGQYKYFDLKGFMRTDSARLVASNPLVDKSVSHNGAVETRQLKIANWGNELSMFTNSDINRPAWRNSYQTKTLGDSTIYLSNEPDLKTKRLIIVKHGDKVASIHIVNHTENLLFEANEDLTYVPDSLYIISKKQQVLILGSNNYLVKGRIIK
ncbi:hypothetical protein [Mucilaginibacter ginkgonis]|uniref:Uncharacterized protein n=1 Tax=Mucilaginibacter ginkgonis TaxID=2682091 RepID=A0A6I4IP32_9SPHI|nr:hypothetical protein [Mucilaginibacter ginkgonis]QQL48458.1 hypothetical protein GO620_009660 [Mucilaginibacter ginkgonis]